MMSKKNNFKLDKLIKESKVNNEDQFHKVKENWCWVKLGSICEINMGQSPKGEYTSENKEDVPLIGGPADMGDIHPNSKRYTSRPTKLSNSGDLIVSIRATLGKTNISDGVYCLGRGVAGISSKIVDVNLLRYYFEFIKDYLYKVSSGTTFSQITKKNIENLPFPLPPIYEQKRIVDKIGRLFGKIDEVKQLIDEGKQTLEIRRASILDRAFRGELTTNWRKENYSLQNSFHYIEMVKHEYFKESGQKLTPIKKIDPKNYPYEIPKEWTWVRAIDVCDVRDGTHDSPKYKEDGYPLITSKNLKGGRLDFSNVKYIDENDHLNISKRSKVDEGDILFAMIGTIGNPVLVREIKQEFSIKNVALFKPFKSISSEFLVLYLESQNYIEQLKKNVKGSTQKFIGLGKLRESLIPVPPIDEQIVIVNKLKKIFNYEEQFINALLTINVDKIKQSILTKAFRGELGTNDPTEDSAIELLKDVLQK